MAEHTNPRPFPRDGEEPLSDPTVNESSLQDEWDQESQRTINEAALRGRPDWVEAIGDEDEDPDRVEQDLQDYGWDLLGEDDFVSNPTTESDSPSWLGDDYDDEYQHHTRAQQDELTDGGDPLDDDRFYSD